MVERRYEKSRQKINSAICVSFSVLFTLTPVTSSILALFVLAVMGAQAEGLNFQLAAMSRALLDIHTDLKHAWYLWGTSECPARCMKDLFSVKKGTLPQKY